MAESHVAVAVVTHAPLGSALKSIAEHIFGEHPGLTVIDVLPGACADDSTESLLKRLRKLDTGAGVLLLTDLPGASPANICVRACTLANQAGMRCEVVAGVNASMVLRVINYATSDLNEIVQVALEGARQTIKRVDS
ncbi:PTS sugar transporter subunit IIA [Orrella daihaiensis]|uniref:PTS sugar transporter subunit IIA n=1 Tax=Orrella daihaiensis TaxID=2782176 RepID=A0ABY4AGK6_9BURK|nr:PTS sugar transporter subunit IIA [Orrella daihaiensis]UOD49411.1 PTS sugar transporter subunit IIA [Orrella daihaiensis]